MDVEDVAQSASSASSEASFVSFNSEDNVSIADQANAEQTTQNEEASASEINPVVPSAEALPQVILNSEEWHRSFPSVSYMEYFLVFL